MQKLNFREFILFLGFLLEFLFHNTTWANFDVENASIASLHTAIESKASSCEKIIQTYLDHIKTYNLSVNEKPPLNAFTTLNTNVLEEARALDHYFAEQGRLKGALHCVPIVLKDNINTFDMTTTGGSFSLLGNQPIDDATLVKKLRNASALFIGKAGMDEFGWGLIGISSRTGRIGNAYDTTQNPGGSSGGCAVAVAAHFALIGIGTDNSGSIRIPSAFNGVYGLRPSTNLVSQHGVIPMGNLDAVAGPITNSIADLAKVLEVIANESDTNDSSNNRNSLDQKTNNAPGIKKYTEALNKNALRGKKIGIVRKIGKFDPYHHFPEEAERLVNAALSRMQKQGAVLIDNVFFEDYITDRMHNQAGEKEDVDFYLKSYPATRKNFQDICESNRTRTFGDVAQCLKFIKGLPKHDSLEYNKVLENFQSNRALVENYLATHNLDALIVPISTHGSATYDIYSVNTWVAPLSSNAGLPALVVNAGFLSNGMPVGIELIAKQYQEPLLIALAYAYEQNTPKRPSPKLVKSKKTLSELSLAEINNVITILGEKSYHSVLKDHSSRELTPETFQKIFLETMNEPVGTQQEN